MEGRKRRAKFDPCETFTKKRMHKQRVGERQPRYFLCSLFSPFLSRFDLIWFVHFLFCCFFLSQTLINLMQITSNQSSRSLNRMSRIAKDLGIRSSHLIIDVPFGNQVVAIFAALKCIHILVVRFFPHLFCLHVYFNIVSALWYDMKIA